MRSRNSDAKLTNLFLDMLAAEQGAGDNTLDAYRRDLTDFSGFLAGSGKGFADVETQGLRDYLADLDARGAKIVISQHPRRIPPLKIDLEMYKWRHLIENFFCKLKEFKRIAMRADKTDQSFASMIHLAAAVINSR